LESTTQQYIQIFELEAYSSGVNVALQGTATQSALYHANPRFDASKAIDGINSTFSHTQEFDAWLEVDLSSSFEIDRVVILNRWCQNSTDPRGCLCRLSDSKLTLYDENGFPVFKNKIGNTCMTLVVSTEYVPCTSAI
jgi:hypothetical protein